MAALMRIRKKDDYTYSHCLSTAVWAVILGRHLGLDKETLKKLALGAALIDVGKMRVDDALLSRQPVRAARSSSGCGTRRAFHRHRPHRQG